MNTSLTPDETRELHALIESHRGGHGLPRPFYGDERVYRAELDSIWRRQWLFAGHACQVKNPGDFFVMEVAGDSLIIIRDDDGGIHALHNTCRHRGSLICLESTGHVKRLVCPYHQWVYDRGGELTGCRGMDESLDKSTLSLIPAQLQEVHGLIYVCLAETPPEFEAARACLTPILQPQGLTRAKVAVQVDYEVAANWKIVWENNRECFHCNVNHPQYVKANFDHYNADDTTARIREQITVEIERSQSKWADQGLAVTHEDTGMTCFPDPDQGIWFAANRTPLRAGYVSESMDGKQVAPLMGDYTDPDMGTVRVRSMPNFWNHSSCDHAVSTRLLPAGPQTTRVQVSWLVHEDAQEGKDYQRDALMPFWQLTSEQDWELCKNAQRGITSSQYRPGPLSPHKEYNVDRFLRWYLQVLAGGLAAG